MSDVASVPQEPVAPKPERRKIITPTFVALIIALLFNAIGTIVLSFVASDTNRVVNYINNQTDPKHIAEQQTQLDQILVRIDCGGRLALQEAFDQLERQGLLAPDSVTITYNCAETTSTTEE